VGARARCTGQVRGAAAFELEDDFGEGAPRLFVDPSAAERDLKEYLVNRLLDGQVGDLRTSFDQTRADEIEVAPDAAIGRAQPPIDPPVFERREDARGERMVGKTR